MMILHIPYTVSYKMLPQQTAGLIASSAAINAVSYTSSGRAVRAKWIEIGKGAHAAPYSGYNLRRPFTAGAQALLAWAGVACTPVIRNPSKL